FALNYAIVLIAAVIAFVAVANFFLSATLDRAPQLHLLQAVGVGPAHIRQAMMAEGALLGIAGVILGLVAGEIVARIIVLRSVPMVTGWHLTFVFPQVAAALASVGCIFLAAL